VSLLCRMGCDDTKKNVPVVSLLCPGKGFYLSLDAERAEDFARRKVDINGGFAIVYQMVQSRQDSRCTLDRICEELL
jgi:hypothetical protein